MDLNGNTNARNDQQRPEAGRKPQQEQSSQGEPHGEQEHQQAVDEDAHGVPLVNALAYFIEQAVEHAADQHDNGDAKIFHSLYLLSL